MIGLNAGLEVARKALSAYQLALSVYSNNIANVNTPGFSRRAPALEESAPTTMSFGRVGLGVDVATVRRMRDRFLDIAYRKEASTLGRYESTEQTLSEMEMVLCEPSDVNISSALGEFWTSWQELANQPENSTARSLVTATASSLCNTLQETARRLTNLREDLDEEVRGTVTEINSIAAKIAAINGEVVSTEVSGAEASDLRDERDSLLDQLASLANISANENRDGSVSVSLGSEALVEKTTVVELGMIRRADRGTSVTGVRMEGQTRTLTPTGGKLAGLIASRDAVIPNYMDKLDEIAAALVRSVNQVHRQGYDLDGNAGGDFFDPAGITAASIDVAEAILGDPSLVAASSDGTPGNGDNALAISDVRLASQLGDGNATIDDYYSTLIGSLGLESSGASTGKTTETLLLGEISNRRESVKGVSIDEEMTNLIAAQHAYQAATKVVSIVDDLMTGLLNTL